MALGAIEAIQGAGLSNQITVVSLDGTEGGIKADENGSLVATIAQKPDEMGHLALQAAYDFYVCRKRNSRENRFTIGVGN